MRLARERRTGRPGVAAVSGSGRHLVGWEAEAEARRASAKAAQAYIPAREHAAAQLQVAYRRHLSARERRGGRGRRGGGGASECDPSRVTGGGRGLLQPAGAPYYAVRARPCPVPVPGRVAPPTTPWAERRWEAWERLLSTWALLTQTWVCHINRVGFEDGIGFGGGTRVIDPFGESAAALEGLDAGTLSARVDSAALDRARVALPLRRDDRAWILARELAQRAEAGGWEGRAE